MRPIPRVWTSASVGAAASEIRDSGLPAVAITQGFLYVAVATQESLAAAMASGVHADDSVERAYDLKAPTLPPYAPGEKALELFSQKGASAIPIVDDYGRLLGVVTPADLFPKRDRTPRPATIGGMATPFGVYLTTGSISAGAGGLALVTTGMFMYAALFGAMLLSTRIGGVLKLSDLVVQAATYVLFLTAFRLVPLSGIHAAEHKVVHAIERGEELTRDNVRRMPRVHPRCGTNLAVGASILIGMLSMTSLIKNEDDRLWMALSAVVFTLLFWRMLGAVVQRLFTTKEPTDKQLDMGIRSGEELLKKYATGRGGRQNLGSRLWHTGLFHVMAGASLTYGLIWLVAWAFHLQLNLN